VSGQLVNRVVKYRLRARERAVNHLVTLSGKSGPKDQVAPWHYTTTILRLCIGAPLTRYRNGKFHNFARTISRQVDGISRYSVFCTA